MEYKEYLEKVNITWGKSQTPEQEKIHCQLSIPEETGEIIGMYKKHFGYGKEKTESWRTRLKEECGDLLYYVTKTADIFNINISTYYLKNYLVESVPLNERGFIKEFLSDMLDSAINVLDGNNAGQIAPGLNSIMTYLLIIIKTEGFTLEGVQKSNIAKLQKRHGEGFNKAAIMDEGRDKNAEINAVKDA
jgi:NTP pyrophosphatase (non-canonical NTP hydrolase)